MVDGGWWMDDNDRTPEDEKTGNGGSWHESPITNHQRSILETSTLTPGPMVDETERFLR